MIGIIGYGRFGRLVVQNLSAEFDVVVYTRSSGKAENIREAGGRLVPLKAACRQKLVVLCVPISAMQATLKEIAPLLTEGTTVIDVCSVKTYPTRWMHDLLPDTVEILATHPMFGPDSASKSLRRHKMVLCPERIDPKRYLKIKAWLEGKGLNIIETSADQHDRQIAVSLALTHFIGRSLSEFGAFQLDIDTEGYKRLLHILEVVSNDTWQLFEDMNHYNPYAQSKRMEFLQAMNKISGILGEQ